MGYERDCILWGLVPEPIVSLFVDMESNNTRFLRSQANGDFAAFEYREDNVVFVPALAPFDEVLDVPRITDDSVATKHIQLDTVADPHGQDYFIDRMIGRFVGSLMPLGYDPHMINFMTYQGWHYVMITSHRGKYLLSEVSPEEVTIDYVGDFPPSLVSDAATYTVRMWDE